ncbi:MAG TPA: NAD(P)-dependent oxidoreductase [Candidatus Elarobacter sp.]|nr:NAD(P)-dependent oxidoreductase [Candidatus Elarobacter sp.]
MPLAEAGDVPRVLLTGANGFVGTAIVPLLVDAGHDVHATVSPGKRGPAGTTVHPCDLTDGADVERLCRDVRATHLMHLAWCTGLRDHKTSDENLRWVAGGVRLLEAFRRNGGTRVVATGTYAEYGTFAGVCREDAMVAPTFLYATAKWSLGSLGLAYGSRAEFAVTWARLFTLYGAGEPTIRLIPQVAESLAAGRAIETTAGSQVRDFVHVHDVARALVVLLAENHHGVANVGTGIGRPIADVVSMVAQRFGRPDLIRAGARTASSSESSEQVADAATLRHFGWAPSVPFEAGLADELDRFTAGCRDS